MGERVLNFSAKHISLVSIHFSKDDILYVSQNKLRPKIMKFLEKLLATLLQINHLDLKKSVPKREVSTVESINLIIKIFSQTQFFCIPLTQRHAVGSQDG